MKKNTQNITKVSGWGIPKIKEDQRLVWKVEEGAIREK